MTAAPAPSSRATRRSARSRARLLGGVPLLLAGALALSACQVASPVSTDTPYNPADGVAIDAGKVVVRDAAVVSKGSGAPGAVIGMVVNEGTEAVTVTVSTDAGPLTPTIDIAPGKAARLDGVALPDGEAGTAVTVPSVTAAAGANMQLTVSSSAGDNGWALVPVLAPVAPYEGLVDDSAATTSG